MDAFLIFFIPSIISVTFFILWKNIAERYFVYDEATNLSVTIVVFVISIVLTITII